MFKKVAPIFATIVVIALVMSLMTINRAAAQDGVLDPNTPISNVDGIMPVSAIPGSTISQPFSGTGKIAPKSPQLDGAQPVAPSIRVENPGSVINTDDRSQILTTTGYPSRAIAYLYVVWQNDTAGSCTGWYIGPRTVVTAGHCVYNAGSGAAHGWAKSIRVYAGRNGASTPFSYTTAHKLFSVTGWTNSSNLSYDYGGIQTNAPSGNVVGWFGWIAQTSNAFVGSYVVRGYPGDKPAATLWTMSGAVTHANTYRQWYSMDTYGGQSGSPLYAARNAICCYGFGVHTYGASISPYFGNSATRFTLAASKNLYTWKASAYP